MELWERMSSELRRAVLMAHDEAARTGKQQIGSAHLALALLRLCATEAPAPESLLAELRRLAEEVPAGEGAEPSFTPTAQRVLLRAMKEARDSGSETVTVEHFLAGLLREEPQIPQAVADHLRTMRAQAAPVKPTPGPWPPAGPGGWGRFQKVFEVPGRYVNDHCLVRLEGQFHLFYIDGEVGQGCYDPGNETIIGHATAADMLGPWEVQAPALVHDPSLPWEERGIFAPFVIAVGDRSYMFYSSHNLAGAQYMCLATSEDLVTWERHAANPLFVPSKSWAYWDEGAPTSCRDPHVVPHEAYGYIMYWVGDMNEPRDHSCIAASVSRDLVHWQEVGPVMIRHHSDLEMLTCKTESPCVIRRSMRWDGGPPEDLYFLFYRHGNGTKVCVSRDPLDFHGRDSVMFSTAHAAEIVEFDGQWTVTNCSRPPGDLAHKEDRRHGLWVARMEWQNGWPVVR